MQEAVTRKRLLADCLLPTDYFLTNHSPSSPS
jgi:hypothetical protein